VAATAGKADLVLHEGVVLGHPGSDSVALGGGVITAHGSFSELKAVVGPRTHLIKLAGRVVAPGLIDSHLHFQEAAAVAIGISVQRCQTIGDLLADLRVAAGRTPPGNWLRAFGCDETLLTEKRGPTRAELDLAIPKNPIRLRHQTLHASWLNSRAIALFGIEAKEFVVPEGATVYADAVGKPTGLVVGMEEWITRHLPIVTKAEAEARTRGMSRELAAAGVTAFTDATVRNGAPEMESFARYVQSGAICQRVGVMIGAPYLDSAEQAAALAHAAGIRLAGAKFMPHAGYDGEAMVAATARAAGFGLDCAYHVTEVEELEEALCAIEAVKPTLAEAQVPIFRIEHGGMIPPNYIDRITGSGAWVVTNPGFIHFRGAKYLDDPGMIPHLYRGESLRRAAIRLAGGTDAPVTPARPLAAIAAAIPRTTLGGKELAPNEKMSSAEAFAMFTRSGARLARLKAGAIEEDFLADLIVLPRDPSALKPADLMNTAVDLTIVGGRVIYERGRPAVANSDSADLHSG
jgi:predicted amidohydrolase YtcJ